MSSDFYIMEAKVKQYFKQKNGQLCGSTEIKFEEKLRYLWQLEISSDLSKSSFSMCSLLKPGHGLGAVNDIRRNYG